MKKALGTIAVFFGIFAIAALASASTADVLQPATSVIYDENLIVNGTGIFDSIKVGKQGVGGVTFFNGTIINETTDENDDPVPVTIGDDVRIDGMIFRSEVGGANPLKISDSLKPTSDSVYSLGMSDSRWADVYVENGDFSGAISVDGQADFNSNVTQNNSSEGILKAWAYVGSSGVIWDSYNVVSVTNISAGKYEVEFNFDVNNGSGRAIRPIMAIPSGELGALAKREIAAGPHASDSKKAIIWTSTSNGALANSSFMLTIY